MPLARTAAQPDSKSVDHHYRAGPLFGAGRLRPGDLVRVRSLEQILGTLDAEGTLDGLPVMPEMLRYCGTRHRVHQRVVQACIDGAFLTSAPQSFVRQFKNADVVTLEGVRCSGDSHGNCQRACAIFWKEAWLQRVDEPIHVEPAADPQAPKSAPSEIRTQAEAGVYVCQSSEILRATLPLSVVQRLRNCLSSVHAGNLSPSLMLKGIARWAWWKSRCKVMGEHARGTLTNTPTQALNLQPGELVKVKSLDRIIATLDAAGRNRGLHFSGDQRAFCGGTYRVRGRADNYVAEGSGALKHFRNTVILEDVLCDSSYYAFGGCYRSEFLYWREIWLERVNDQPALTGTTPDAPLS